MGFVTAIFARRMIQAAGEEIDPREALRSIGLDPDGPMDVNERVGAEAYYDLLERIARQMERGHVLPLRVGPLMRPDDYGALGLAWKSAPTVRDSLERVARFCRVWTDNMTYEIQEQDGGIDFVLHRFGERRLGMRLSNEATVSSAASLVRQTAATGFRPRAVYLQHKAPETTRDHERYFGCPVHFGADKDAISLSDEALAHPNHLADDGISTFLVSHLEQEIESADDGGSIESLTRRAISKALSDGMPRMATVAKRLAMSERTLQRRLADQDLTFKQLVEATQADLAKNLLRQSAYALSEVAFLTGFSEQSAFNRAFKRWTGSTPMRFRAEVEERAKR
ncbi:MAG: AraC family transcriptional regulator [Planctomycetota bacterium]|nr:AraC family transcriptional regulator [Planctomycetota bacterium]